MQMFLRNEFVGLWDAYKDKMRTYSYQEYRQPTRINGVITDATWGPAIDVFGSLIQISEEAKSSDSYIKNSEATHSFITKSKLKLSGRIKSSDKTTYAIISAGEATEICGFNEYFLKATEYDD